MSRSVYYPRVGIKVNAVFDGARGPDSAIRFNCIPYSSRVQRNRYDEPDTFSVEFDARYLPFDPQMFRGAQVAVYMFDAQNMAEPAASWERQENHRLSGVVDESGLHLSSSGHHVTMTGRDYSAIFAAKDWDPRERIRRGRPLDVTVQWVMDQVQSGLRGDRMTVSYLGSVERPTAPIVGRGLRGKNRKYPIAVKSGKTAWDVIYDLCRDEGCIVYVDNLTVIIQASAVVEQGNLIPVMVYGRNLETLSATRKFTKDMVPQVEARGRLPDGKLIVEKYPSKPTTDGANVIPGVGTSKDRVKRITRQRIPNRGKLREIARLEYERMARGEAVYKFSTPHLQDTEGRSLLDLRAGLPVRILWDAFKEQTLRSLPAGSRIDYLISLGYSPEVASVVSNHLERFRQFQQPYYVQEVEMSIDDGGFELRCTASNYVIESREAGETIRGASQQASAGIGQVGA